jgi:hypothetical protein
MKASAALSIRFEKALVVKALPRTFQQKGSPLCPPNL